jgi:hypothetical protein
MRLYDVSFLTIRDGEPHYLIVAENEEDAKQKAEEKWDDYHCGISIYEIQEIDGYKILFKKGKKINLENDGGKLNAVNQREYPIIKGEDAKKFLEEEKRVDKLRKEKGNNAKNMYNNTILGII